MEAVVVIQSDSAKPRAERIIFPTVRYLSIEADHALEISEQTKS